MVPTTFDVFMKCAFPPKDARARPSYPTGKVVFKTPVSYGFTTRLGEGDYFSWSSTLCRIFGDQYRGPIPVKTWENFDWVYYDNLPPECIRWHRSGLVTWMKNRRMPLLCTEERPNLSYYLDWKDPIHQMVKTRVDDTRHHMMMKVVLPGLQQIGCAGFRMNVYHDYYTYLNSKEWTDTTYMECHPKGIEKYEEILWRIYGDDFNLGPYVPRHLR